ncbi:MAG: NRAMP family divalent metal transporter [Sulfobacillus sp.]
MRQPLASGLVTHEDRDRARDRLSLRRAYQTHGPRRWLWLLWLSIGPGILVMLGENDAPSMLSYAATGSQFGIGFFLPFIVITFVMAVVVQEMAMRIGAVTHRGFSELMADRFGGMWGGFLLADLLFGNLLTLITEFIGIRAGLGYFHVPPPIAVSAAIVVIGVAITTGRYWTWERLIMALAIFNAVFVPIAILSHPAWSQVAGAMIRFSPMPVWNSNTVLVLVADIGATVTPWMIFFQQAAVADKGLTPADMHRGRLDTVLGAVLAAAFAVAAVVATSALFRHGISVTNYQTANFASALRPLVGRVGASLFALGIVEAGLVAAIAISTASAYAFAEVRGQSRSLNRPLKEAWSFYLTLIGVAVVAGAVVLIPHIPLELVVLLVNVVAVLSTPPIFLFLLLLANDRQVMGEWVNRTWQNWAAVAVGALITLAGLLFALSVLDPRLI